MPALAGLICASTSGSQFCIAQSVGVVSLLRNKGYIVQTFVLAQTPAPACHLLQHISGRRVVSLEPWLHAGSTLQNVFWSSTEGADAAVIVVPDSLLEAGAFDLPAWSLCLDLLEKLQSPVLLFASATDSTSDIHQACTALTPDLLLLTGPDGFTAASGFPHNIIHTAKQLQPSCSMLGVLPAASIHPAMHALHSEPATADPMAALFSSFVAFSKLESAMASASPHRCIPRPAQPLPAHVRECCASRGHGSRARIAVATDMGAAPSQLQGNLAVLEALGCELRNVSLTDATCLPPDVTGLFLSACLTPDSADALAANLSMRLSVAAFAAAGGVIYAEGAGLAYLSTSVRIGEESFSMAGVLPMHVIMHEEAQVRGYVRLRVQEPEAGGVALMEPGAWLRGVADSCLEVREEVASRGLGQALRINQLKVAQLFEALLVDLPAGGCSRQGSGGGGAGPAIAQASQMHGIDTVQEGYARGAVAATLVHVAFASHMAAVQPLVAACAARDAGAIAAAAAAHAAARRRCAVLTQSHRRSRASLPHSRSESCVRAVEHPLVRLSGESASTASSPPRSMTPTTSSSTPSTESLSTGSVSHVATAASLAGSVMPPLAPLRTASADTTAARLPSDALLGVSRARDIPPGPAGRQRLPLVGSVPENLWQPHEVAEVSRSASHSALRPAGQQWWMQPLPRVRMLSGWELSAGAGPLWPANSVDSSGFGSARPSADVKAAACCAKGFRVCSMDDPHLPSPTMTAANSLLEPFPGAPASRTLPPDVRPIVALSPSVIQTLHMLGLGDHVAGGHVSAAGPPKPVLSLLAGEPTGPPRPRFVAPGHRRTNSATKDLTLPGPWRSAARRVAFTAGDWAPLHELHAERIAALGSPLVLTWEPERVFAKEEGGVLPVAEAAHAPVLDALRRMDAPADVVTLPPPRSVSDVFAAVSCVGAVVGAAAAAEALVERLRGALRAVAARCFAAPPPAPRRVLVLRSVAPYIVAGGWMPELVRLAGATAVGAAPGDGAREIEWKHVAEFDPDAIVVLSEVVTLDDACTESAVLASEHGWWGLRAVRQRDVYVADGAAMQGAGPGVVAAMEAMARVCRPDLRVELGDGPGEVGLRKLEMAEGQRCRPSLLPGFFREMTW